jgi:hypothetical protein
MNLLTISVSDSKLNACIRRLATREGISLNSAALKLLRKGATLTEIEGKKDSVGNSLDHFIGTWTKEQADELDAALEEFEAIDESMWK